MIQPLTTPFRKNIQENEFNNKFVQTSVAFQQSENPKWRSFFFLANHVSVGPSLVDAVSDHRRDVYLSFFEPEKGSKRENKDTDCGIQPKYKYL